MAFGRLAHGRLNRGQIIGHNRPAGGHAPPLPHLGGQHHRVVLDNVARLHGLANRL